MPAMPGDPEDVIMYYGQSMSIVEYMVLRLGPRKMVHLLSRLKSGDNIDDAILSSYGISKLELENSWRVYIGAPLYEPPAETPSLPTPMPRSEVKVFSLTPQAGSTAVESLTGNVPQDEIVLEEPIGVTVEMEETTDGRSCGKLRQSAPDGSVLLLGSLLLFVGLKRPFSQVHGKFNRRNGKEFKP